MHGIGNDYIFFDCFSSEVPDPKSVALRFSDRRFGIGADGVILILPSAVADGEMRMYNSDGSEGKMCGNGIRCVGKFLYDNGRVGNRKNIAINTLSGIKRLELYTGQNGKVERVKVDMGKAIFDPEYIPVKLPGEKIVNRKVDISGRSFFITCLSMGNPHCVIFTDPQEADVEGTGALIERSEIFPEGSNVEFVKPTSENSLEMRVWERGSGETYACGTGACASVAAGVENGCLKKDEDVTVRLKGGELTVRYTDESVFLTGNCEYVYRGEIDI